MTARTQQDVLTIRRISAATDAAELAAGTYRDLIALLETLGPADWAAPTDCAPWTVADIVGHVIGAAEANASLPRLVRQQLWARRQRHRFDGNELDAANHYQVERHAHLDPEQRIAALRRLSPAAIRGRLRVPGALHRVRIPLAPAGSTPAGMPAFLTLGHLMEVVLTRDVWLHRIDIARAVGRAPDLTPDVDGRIVADAVAEWAAHHGEPFVLCLTGPAGGTFRQGEQGERFELDAVEFCRVLSGRAPGRGLMGVRIAF